MEEKGTPVNQSAERLLLIIEYLAQARTPKRLLDISRDLKINKSTLLRFLLTLQNHGYVIQDEYTARYSLTYKICTIASRVKDSIDIRELCTPAMHKISAAFGESVSLAIEQNQKAVYIEIVEGPELMLRTMQRIGKVAPLYCTGIGKLFLLNLSDKELEEYAAKEKMTKFTENTITNLDALKAELARVRENGYAFDNEECEIGARCIAMPIRDMSGRVIAGISATGPTTRMTDAHIQENLPVITRATQELSQRMGYQPDHDLGEAGK